MVERVGVRIPTSAMSRSRLEGYSASGMLSRTCGAASFGTASALDTCCHANRFSLARAPGTRCLTLAQQLFNDASTSVKPTFIQIVAAFSALIVTSPRGLAEPREQIAITSSIKRGTKVINAFRVNVASVQQAEIQLAAAKVMYRPAIRKDGTVEVSITIAREADNKRPATTSTLPPVTLAPGQTAVLSESDCEVTLTPKLFAAEDAS